MSDWTKPPTAASRSVTASTSGVLHPTAMARHVDLQRWPAGPGLSRWVENYWGLRWDLPAATTYPSQVLAHPTCSLSLERATRPRSGVPPRATLVTGVATRRFDVPVAGKGTVIGVKFRPGGLVHLLGASARDWTDRTLGADTVLPPRAAHALAELEPEALHEEGLGRLEQVLQLLVDLPVDRDEQRYDLLLRMVGDMLADRSLVSVSQLSALHGGISERTLQRWFGHYLGVGPKWVLRRYRMHDVVSEIDAGYDGPLADLAHRHGWYDQPHFNRDFKSLVGVSPSDYLAAR